LRISKTAILARSVGLRPPNPHKPTASGHP